MPPHADVTGSCIPVCPGIEAELGELRQRKRV